MSEPVDSVHFDGIFQQTYNFRDWSIVTRRSHILQSKCSDNCEDKPNSPCLFCKFGQELSLVHLPDMTFAKNILRIVHKKGFGLEFDCLNALKSIPKTAPEGMKVDSSEEWLKAREDCQHSKRVPNPFDWTFTTKYKGHLIPSLNGQTLIEEPTNEIIDIAKLKVKENILFYDEVHLFEDELADNGVAQCSVKIRVMQHCFFILLRYFLRVDKVMVRINDTRIFYETDKNYMLREYTSKEQDISKIALPIETLLDPVLLSQQLPTKEKMYHKLKFPC